MALQKPRYYIHIKINKEGKQMTTELSTTAQALLDEWDSMIYETDDVESGLERVEALMNAAEADGIISWDEYCAIEYALGF